MLNAEKLNRGFMVFVSVKMQRLNRDIASEFMKKVSEMPEVTECYNVSGQYDYVLKVHVNDMRAYQQFVINELGTIDHLSHIESVFVMDEVKQDYGLNF